MAPSAGAAATNPNQLQMISSVSPKDFHNNERTSRFCKTLFNREFAYIMVNVTYGNLSMELFCVNQMSTSES